jgi:hypothetical protein
LPLHNNKQVSTSCSDSSIFLTSVLILGRASHSKTKTRQSRATERARSTGSLATGCGLGAVLHTALRAACLCGQPNQKRELWGAARVWTLSEVCQAVSHCSGSASSTAKLKKRAVLTGRTGAVLHAALHGRSVSLWPTKTKTGALGGCAGESVDSV